MQTDRHEKVNSPFFATVRTCLKLILKTNMTLIFRYKCEECVFLLHVP